MIRPSVRSLPLLAVVLLVLTSCGGGGSSPSGSASASRQIDLASADHLLLVTYRAGEVGGIHPSSITSGDFNGDGKPDLLLGVPLADGPGGSRVDAGEADVLYGPLSGDIDLSQRQPDVRIYGAVAGDNLGGGVATGDLNGDGNDDMVVGAPLSNGLQNLRTDMGEAYVVFGGPQLPSVIDGAAVQENVDLLPAEGFSQLGATFAVADVNGDGIDDLIAGAPYAGREPGTPPGGARTTVGEVYIVYGSQSLSGQVSVARDEENVRLSGVTGFDQFGDSVAAADVNGDGVADIIVGASGYDGPAPGRSEAGGAFVFYGGSHLPKRATLSDANSSILGADAGDTFGSVVSAVDVNGDGKADVIASSPSASGPANNRPASGEMTVVDVAKSASNSIDLSQPGSGFRVFEPAAGELGPSSLAESMVSGAVRLILGSDMHGSSDRSVSGAAYVVDAPTSADSDLEHPAAGSIMVLGAAANDGLGGSVAFADLDGDGVPELLVLASGNPTVTGSDPNFRAKLYALRLN